MNETQKRSVGRPVGTYAGKYPRKISKKPTAMYIRWYGVICRCTRPRTHNYKYYGGRGITVCDRWQGKQGFDNFCDDLGECPPGLTVERINNDGPYSPENCRWATMAEQALNRRKTGRITPDSLRQKTLSAGLPYMQIYFRIHRLGWTEERALSTPIGPRGRPYRREAGQPPAWKPHTHGVAVQAAVAKAQAEFTPTQKAMIGSPPTT